MKKEDIILLVLALSLLLAAILTFLFGGERSRHGYGAAREHAGPGPWVQAVSSGPGFPGCRTGGSNLFAGADSG